VRHVGLDRRRSRDWRIAMRCVVAELSPSAGRVAPRHISDLRKQQQIVRTTGSFFFKTSKLRSPVGVHDLPCEAAGSARAARRQSCRQRRIERHVRGVVPSLFSLRRLVLLAIVSPCRLRTSCGHRRLRHDARRKLRMIATFLLFAAGAASCLFRRVEHSTPAIAWVTPETAANPCPRTEDWHATRATRVG